MSRFVRNCCLVGAMAMVLGACGQMGGGEAGEDRGPLDIPRGLGKADSAFSCQGYCGKKAPGCYCDSKCEKLGDCCPDKAKVCDNNPLPKMCGGIAGIQCPSGYKCKLDGSYPDAGGKCVPQDSCDTAKDCSGLIHPSCMGQWECKSSKCHWKCGVLPVTCQGNKDCNSNQYCEYGDSMCLNPTFTILTGVCKTTPTLCTKEFMPVCGCDNKTYSNACHAHGAGTSVASKGACNKPVPPPPCNMLAQKACDVRTDCDWETTPGFPGPISMCVEKKGKKCGPFLGGQCGAGDVCNIKSCAIGATGTCVEQPKSTQCFEYMWKLATPVCGCDGKTYGNDCMRLAAGATFSHSGACKATPPPKTGTCWQDKDCNKNEFCGYASGQCLLPTFNILEGKCAPKPQACIQLYDPVCGCDGKTHGNACMAASKGANVAYKGACKPVNPKAYCKGYCGQKAPSGCYCDQGCEKYSDCCPDVKSACLIL
jgi:hypothetical protein